MYTSLPIRQFQASGNIVVSDSTQSEQSGQRNGGQEGGGKGQSASKRFTFKAWGDETDRDLCAHALVDPPQRTPISGRTGLATARWVMVDRTGSRALICNRLHDGPCEWPWAVEFP